MRLYKGDANTVYPQLVNDCLVLGDEIHVRGTSTRELHPVCVELTDPHQPLVTSRGRPINVAFALAEVLWILQGRRDVGMLEFYNSKIAQFSDYGHFFNAAYGYRLRHAYGYDQIEDVIRTLTDDPQSRQAVLTIWHPDDRGWDTYIDNPDDPPEIKRNSTKDRACNYTAHIMIRNGALDWLHNVRSNDVILGVPHNWVQFTSLQQYIAQRLGVKQGSFWYIADSMHLYIDTYYDGTQLDIQPFNLYHEYAMPHNWDFSDKNLEFINTWETNIRAGQLSSLPVLTGDVWQRVLNLFLAHHFYKQHQDERTLELLGFVPVVFGASQARFYWVNRWSKWSDTFISKDVIDVIPKTIRELWSERVADWVMA